MIKSQIYKTLMIRAISQANIAYSIGEVPVGAVVVNNKKVIAEAHNQNYNNKNIFAHAEILVIKKAIKLLGTQILDNCDLYVTLEPCIMCSGAISLSRIRRLYFGAYDIKNGSIEHGNRIFDYPSLHHKPEIIGGILETDCSKILTNFFKKLRS